MAKQSQQNVAVVLAMVVVLCVSMGAEVSAQNWPAPAPYIRGWEPSSAPGYAPEYAPSYAPAWAPEGSPLSEPVVASPAYAPSSGPSSFESPAYAPGPVYGW